MEADPRGGGAGASAPTNPAMDKGSQKFYGIRVDQEIKTVIKIFGLKVLEIFTNSDF